MSNKKRSIIAGILYLALIIPGPFAYILIPDMISGQADPSLYVSQHMMTIVLWLILDLIIIGIEIVLTFYLLKIFDQFNKKLSFAAFILRALVVFIMFINVAYLITLLANQGTNALEFVNLHIQGTFIWQTVFSFHVMLLGYMLLKYKPDYIKYLGYILILGGIGYFLDAMDYFMTLSNYLLTISNILLVFVTLGEIATGIALLFNKINQKEA